MILKIYMKRLDHFLYPRKFVTCRTVLQGVWHPDVYVSVAFIGGDGELQQSKRNPLSLVINHLLGTVG